LTKFFNDESMVESGLIIAALQDPATGTLPDGGLKDLMIRLAQEYEEYETPPVMVIRHLESSNGP
jgi:hypothetical protein